MNPNANGNDSIKIAEIADMVLKEVQMKVAVPRKVMKREKVYHGKMIPTLPLFFGKHNIAYTNLLDKLHFRDLAPTTDLLIPPHTHL